MVICADCSPTELVTHEIDNKFNVTIKGYLLLYILNSERFRLTV